MNMKVFFRTFLKFLISLFPLKRNYIIFESYPELDGSPWMIYKEFIKRGFDKKYKLVWFVDANYKAPNEINSVVYFGNWNIFQKMYGCIIIAKAKIIIDSNRYVKKIHSRTFRLHTRHGGTIKKADNYSNQIGNVDYILSLSDEMANIEHSLVYKNSIIHRNQFLTLGYPNNDRLFDSTETSLRNLLRKQNLQFDKIIGWTPTFRRHRIGNRIDSAKTFSFGVPLFDCYDNIKQLNNMLHSKKIILIIKTHHSEMFDFKQKKLSNIIFLNQVLEKEQNISIIDLIKSFDALITDYSSVYYEFLLLNRPIALTIDDFEEYSSGTGFSIDYFDWIKGVYLKDIFDLMHFAEDVSNDIDSAKNEREKTLHRIYKYIDNHSTERVVDFLVNRAEL